MYSDYVPALEVETPVQHASTASQVRVVACGSRCELAGSL